MAVPSVLFVMVHRCDASLFLIGYRATSQRHSQAKGLLSIAKQTPSYVFQWRQFSEMKSRFALSVSGFPEYCAIDLLSLHALALHV